MKPTLGRIVHYRLLDRWIVGIVVNDDGATEDLAVEIELHPGERGCVDPDFIRAWMSLGTRRPLEFPKHPKRGFAKGADIVHVEDRWYPFTMVRNVKRGEEPGNWRWPPKE